MTPRQLIVLSRQHRIFNGEDTPTATTAAPAKPQGTFRGKPAEPGSTGWLLATSLKANQFRAQSVG